MKWLFISVAILLSLLRKANGLKSCIVLMRFTVFWFSSLCSAARLSSSLCFLFCVSGEDLILTTATARPTTGPTPAGGGGTTEQYILPLIAPYGVNVDPFFRGALNPWVFFLSWVRFVLLLFISPSFFSFCSTLSIPQQLVLGLLCTAGTTLLNILLLTIRTPLLLLPLLPSRITLLLPTPTPNTTTLHGATITSARSAPLHPVGKRLSGTQQQQQPQQSKSKSRIRRISV